MATIKKRGKSRDGKDSWLIRYYVDGQQKCKTFHGTEKQAERYGIELEIKRNEGEVVENTKQTVEEYLKLWLETYQKPAVTAKTYKENERLLELHVFPTIGKKKLQVVNTLDCQKTINAITAKGHTRTAVATFNLLKKAFRQAKRLQLIAKNPMEDVIKPKDHAAERPFLSTEQAQKLLEAAKSDHYYALIAFLLLTGVRPEEAFGLQWDGVDLQARTVQIKQALKRQPGDGWIIDELKTIKSRRQLDIGATLTAILIEHKRTQAAKRLENAKRWHHYNFVFASRVGGPNDISKLRRHLTMILKKAELPQIRVYDLRHTHGSLMLEQGIHIKTISDRLGHADGNMTINRYLHVHPSVSRQAVDVLDAALNVTQEKNVEDKAQ